MPVLKLKFFKCSNTNRRNRVVL